MRSGSCGNAVRRMEITLKVRKKTQASAEGVTQAYHPKSGSWPLIYQVIVMIYKNILCCLSPTFRVSPLRARLHSFCSAWQCCSQRLGMGRPGASHERPRAAGIGQRRGSRDRVHGAGIPLRGRTFLRKALLLPARSRHSASLRLALHPKNHTLRPIQLPDLG